MAEDRGAKPVVHTKKHLARLERERRQTRLILITFIGIMVMAVGLLVYGYLDVNYFQLEKPVAKVGDVSIKVRDFQTVVRVYRENLLNTYQQYYIYQQYGIDMSAQLQQMEKQLNDNQTLGQDALNKMIDDELIRQETAKRGITVSEQEVEDRIRQIKGFFPMGSPTPSVTPTDITQPTDSAAILKYLTPTSPFTATPELTGTPEFTPTAETTAAADLTLTPAATGGLTGTPAAAGDLTSTPTSTATLEPSATATATSTITPTATLSGSPTPQPTSTPFTLEAFEELYGQDVEHYKKYGLTEEMLRDFYRTDLLREKLFEEVSADVEPTELQVRARHILVQTDVEANSIIASLKGGADFGKIAQEKSLDTGSGMQGGDLGWFGHGVMQPAFEEAAFALEVGEISGPVETVYGFHVIQVIDKAERPLDAQAHEDARNRAFDEFLTSLRDTYKVETYDDVWIKFVPNEPSFASLATEAAKTQGAE